MATRKRTPATKRATKKRASPRPPARTSAAKKTRAQRAAPGAGAKAAQKKPVARKGATTRVPSKTAAGRTKVAKAPRGARGATAAPRVETARRLAEPPAADASLFPCGDEALRAATGKDWSEWFAVLDAAGAAARRLDHQRVWDLAMQSLPETAGWWGQMVSVGYERARGLREKHESCSGEFQATSSKTFPVPLFAAFAAWADAGLRGAWLDAPGLTFTKLNAGRNIRARWPNGALLDIRFNATGPDKCQIVVDTMKLDDGNAVQQAKAFWQAQFERLQKYFNA